MAAASPSSPPREAIPHPTSQPMSESNSYNGLVLDRGAQVRELLQRLCAGCNIDVDTLHDVVAKQEVIEKYRRQLLEDGVDHMDDMFVELKGMLNKLDQQRIFYENSLGVDLYQEAAAQTQDNHPVTVAMYLYQMRMFIEDKANNAAGAARDTFCAQVFRLDILGPLLLHMKEMRTDEVRRCVVAVVGYLFRQAPDRAVRYFQGRPALYLGLIDGYRGGDVALACGPILRILLRHQPLCKLMLESPRFMDFFEHVQQKSFEISSDAFSTFKKLVTRHQAMAAAFLEEHAQVLLRRWNEVMCSRNYVAKRQAINFLIDLIMDRGNFKFMMKYLSDVENLDVVLSLLMGKSQAIAHDSFSLFKIFVLNPRKTAPIQKRLVKKRDQVAPILIRMLAEEKQKLPEEAALPQLQQVLETYMSLQKPEKKDKKDKKGKKEKKSKSSSLTKSKLDSKAKGSSRGLSPNQVLLQGAIAQVIANDAQLEQQQQQLSRSGSCSPQGGSFTSRQSSANLASGSSAMAAYHPQHPSSSSIISTTSSEDFETPRGGPGHSPSAMLASAAATSAPVVQQPQQSQQGPKTPLAVPPSPVMAGRGRSDTLWAPVTPLRLDIEAADDDLPSPQSRERSRTVVAPTPLAIVPEYLKSQQQQLQHLVPPPQAHPPVQDVLRTPIMEHRQYLQQQHNLQTQAQHQQLSPVVEADLAACARTPRLRPRVLEQEEITPRAVAPVPMGMGAAQPTGAPMATPQAGLADLSHLLP